MRFDIITLFPEAFRSPLEVSLLGKAIQAGLVEVAVHDLRDWSEGPHRKVDDEPFGGGAGMVIGVDPVVRAVEEVRADGSPVFLLTAAGRAFTQSLANELAEHDQVVLVCGRYEGIDARAAGILGATELSVGEYVLAGGEVAALVVLETVGRLIPGVMGNADSGVDESFTSGLLEYPQYTRPSDYRGVKAPEVLLSGDHKRIVEWRRLQALRKTFENRPQLLEAADLTDQERKIVGKWRQEGLSSGDTN